MAKQDKEFKWRMEGYVAALRFAKEHGVEALGKEIQRRGFYNIPIQFSKKDVDKFMLEISANLTNTMTTVMLYTLHKDLGFGKIRLTRIKKLFEDNAQAIFDYDYLGEHYVKIEDYAVDLNDKYNLGMDVDRVAACQDSCRYEKDRVGMAKLKDIVEVLDAGGFKDAADFLRKKVY